MTKRFMWLSPEAAIDSPRCRRLVTRIVMPTVGPDDRRRIIQMDEGAKNPQ
ncbi:MAG: hypothetical protein ACREEK_15495 [Bradyrhizobium sp.]